MATLTMITAHTGCEDTPKNSLEFIRAALESGADCMEIDLRLQNGRPVLSHDPLEEGQSYVTLDQCLRQICEADIQVNCDLKDAEAFLSVLKLFREYGMEKRLIFTGSYPLDQTGAAGDYRVFINGESLVDAQNAKELSRELLDELLEGYARYSRDSVVAGLNLPHRAMTDEAIQILKDHEIPLSLWTVDDPEILRRAFGWQVSNITTNRPVFAIRMRTELDR